jgi:hypothetical protein
VDEVHDPNALDESVDCSEYWSFTRPIFSAYGLLWTLSSAIRNPSSRSLMRVFDNSQTEEADERE